MKTQNPSKYARRLSALILAAALPSLLLASGAEAKRRKRSRAKATLKGQVNINTAKARQLRLLPRVGKRVVKAIKLYRASKPFTAIRDLMRVKGIGKKTFIRIKSYLTVSGPTTLRKVRKARRKRASKARRASRSKGRSKARRKARSKSRRKAHPKATKATKAGPTSGAKQ